MAPAFCHCCLESGGGTLETAEDSGKKWFASGIPCLAMDEKTSGRGDFGISGKGCFGHDSGNAVDFGYFERTADGDHSGLKNAVVDSGLDGTSALEK